MLMKYIKTVVGKTIVLQKILMRERFNLQYLRNKARVTVFIAE